MCPSLGLFPRVLKVVRTSAQSGSRPPTVPVPEMRIILLSVPEKDTGGERWVLTPKVKQA